MAKEFSRKSRVNAELHRELASLIREELTDPRTAHVTVTRVEISPDLRHARVLVSLLGDDAQLAEAVTALKGASGRLRHALASRLKLRLLPVLQFLPDTQLREADRLSQLIHEARTRDDAVRNALAGGPDAPEPPAPGSGD